MEVSKSHGYAQYLVLADKSNGELRANYANYLNFKKVKEVINNIAFTDKSTYSFEGTIYNRKITSTDAKKIISNIESIIWTDTTGMMKFVANQLGLTI
tara:strand:- start:190 stop:483 length:294 start_codon:yes stop_codon:yes gene_type:complete